MDDKYRIESGTDGQPYKLWISSNANDFDDITASELRKAYQQGYDKGFADGVKSAYPTISVGCIVPDDLQGWKFIKG